MSVRKKYTRALFALSALIISASALVFSDYSGFFKADSTSIPVATLSSTPLKCANVSNFQSNHPELNNPNNASNGLSIWHSVTGSHYGSEFGYLNKQNVYGSRSSLSTAGVVAVGQVGQLGNQTLTITCDGGTHTGYMDTVTTNTNARWYVAQDGSTYWCNSSHDFSTWNGPNACNLDWNKAMIPDHVWVKAPGYTPECSNLNTESYSAWSCQNSTTKVRTRSTSGFNYNSTTQKCTDSFLAPADETEACASGQICSAGACKTPQYNVSVSASPSQKLTFAAGGGRGTTTFTINNLTSTSQSINFAVAGNPVNPSCVMSHSSYTVQAGGVASPTMTCFSENNAIGSYPVTLTFTPGNTQYDPIVLPYTVDIVDPATISDSFLPAAALVITPASPEGARLSFESGRAFSFNARVTNTLSQWDTFTLSKYIRTPDFSCSLSNTVLSLEPNQGADIAVSCTSNIVPVSAFYGIDFTLVSDFLQRNNRQSSIIVQHLFQLTVPVAVPGGTINTGSGSNSANNSGGNTGSGLSGSGQATSAPSGNTTGNTGTSGSGSLSNSGAPISGNTNNPATPRSNPPAAPNNSSNSTPNSVINPSAPVTAQPGTAPFDQIYRPSASGSGTGMPYYNPGPDGADVDDRDFENDEAEYDFSEDKARISREMQRYEQHEKIMKLLGDAEARLDSKVNEVAEVIQKQSEELINKMFEFTEKHQKRIEATLDAMTRVNEKFQEDYMTHKVAMMEKVEALDAKISRVENLVNERLELLKEKILGYNFIGAEGDIVQNKFESLLAKVEEGAVSSNDVDLLIAQTDNYIEDNQRYKLDQGIVPFLDVNDDVWYRDFVSTVKERGLAQGLKDDSGQLTYNFAPGNEVTVAEILKMALNSGGFDEMVYDDAGRVPANPLVSDHWAKKYFLRAEELGIDIVSAADPNRPATRGEVMEIILQANGITPDSIAGLQDSGFSDLTVDHPQAAWILHAKNLGIVKGDDNAKTFRADKGINRAESAKVLTKLIDLE